MRDVAEILLWACIGLTAAAIAFVVIVKTVGILQ